MSAWAGSVSDISNGRSACAYLAGEDAIEALRGVTAVINDRGRKHPARSLSALLIGQVRVPLVRAGFRSTRQLARSVRTLLERAVEARERKAYVIGIPPETFEAAAARAGAQFQQGVGETPSSDPWSILLDPEDVPPELEEQLVGSSPEMQAVRQWIVRAARHRVPVLVLGDSGTGKEVVARWIHLLAQVRERQPFLAVNCGAIPQELFESEVFGYEPGAFTNAHPRGSQGIWRSAAGGTVFLDEIAELTPAHQAKLLRVLEQRTVRPVGATKEVLVDARVIAATNRDLFSMVRSGEFREDLYYRLGSIIIHTPRLRERAEDIPFLAAYFWREVAPGRPALSSDVLRELSQCSWHGNARELRYILVSLHITFPKSEPTVDRLRAVLRMRLPPEDHMSEDGFEGALRLVDALRHLRRVRAAIDACRRVVRHLRAAPPDADRLSRLQADVAGCLTELQLLAGRPERFRTLPTFEAAHRLAGALAAVQSLLARHDERTTRYARKELVNEVAAAGTVVRREEERLLKML